MTLESLQASHPDSALRVARKRRGWTQAELAHHAGCHKITVCKLESGKTQPGLHTAIKLAEALGVRVESLWHTVDQEAVDAEEQERREVEHINRVMRGRK